MLGVVEALAFVTITGAIDFNRIGIGFSEGGLALICCWY
jgi:hypothetical protein